MKITFEDESELELPELWIECIKIKYNLGPEEYWEKIAPYIRRLWSEGKVLTKFGEEPINLAFDDQIFENEEYCEPTMAWHAESCIYADLRACLMAKAMASYGRNVKVIGIDNDKVTIYNGKEKKEYDNIEDALKDE